jgi:uncharacterized lipoprotein YmbA
MNRFALFSKQFVKTALIFLLMLVLVGCMARPSKPPQTFLLNDLGESLAYEKIFPEGINKNNIPAIGVGPVKIPEYLNRPQIVTRSEGNEIFIEEYHRWAEPLKDSISRVLSRNLSWLLATDHVFVFPWPGAVKPDYRVTMNIFRFDGRPGGEVYLDVFWAVYRGDDNFLVESKRSFLKTMCRDDSHEALVEAHNLLLFHLSREIADAIRFHPHALQSH